MALDHQQCFVYDCYLGELLVDRMIQPFALFRRTSDYVVDESEMVRWRQEVEGSCFDDQPHHVPEKLILPVGLDGTCQAVEGATSGIMTCVVRKVLLEGGRNPNEVKKVIGLHDVVSQ